DQNLRHRPGAFRHHHDPQSWHRPAYPSSGTNHGRRLRDRKGVDGSRLEEHPRLLHSDGDRAFFGNVHSSPVVVAASYRARLTGHADELVPMTCAPAYGAGEPIARSSNSQSSAFRDPCGRSPYPVVLLAFIGFVLPKPKLTFPSFITMRRQRQGISFDLEDPATSGEDAATILERGYSEVLWRFQADY